MKGSMGKAVEKYKEWLTEQERVKALSTARANARREKKRQSKAKQRGYRERIYGSLDSAIARDGE